MYIDLTDINIKELNIKVRSGVKINVQETQVGLPVNTFFQTNSGGKSVFMQEDIININSYEDINNHPGKQLCFNQNGTNYYYKNGQRHRDGDKPAREHANGTKEYYKNGKLHRDGNKPAIERNNGDKVYYKNGKMYNP